MTIYRAFIVEATDSSKIDKVYNEMMSGDRIGMPYRIPENDDSKRQAIIIYDKTGDEKVSFQEVAAMVAAHGGTRLPSDQFRNLNTFKPWPANFATIEVS